MERARLRRRAATGEVSGSLCSAPGDPDDPDVFRADPEVEVEVVALGLALCRLCVVSSRLPPSLFFPLFFRPCCCFSLSLFCQRPPLSLPPSPETRESLLLLPPCGRGDCCCCSPKKGLSTRFQGRPRINYKYYSSLDCNSAKSTTYDKIETGSFVYQHIW